MESLGAIQTAEQKVLHDVTTLAGNLRAAVKHDPDSVREAAALLWNVRKLCYEDLNQIQHEYLILQSVSWLTRAYIVPKSASWQWNPRQTGGATEADLQASVDGTVLLSAEMTASDRPVGKIRERMIRALEKLRAMPGLHYYIVRNADMGKAAERLALRACPDARVLVIDFDALDKQHLVIPLQAVQDVNLPHPAEPDWTEDTEAGLADSR